MSPRNLDDNCKDKAYSEEKQDCQYFLPNILHKKHKVIKLVKAQLLGLKELRFTECCESPDTLEINFQEQELGLSSSENGVTSRSGQLEHMQTQDVEEFGTAATKSPFLWFIILLITIFLLLLMAAWLSAGPLSNRVPHTPIPWISLLKTDGICELERKYLLRWSMSNHVE